MPFLTKSHCEYLREDLKNEQNVYDSCANNDGVRWVQGSYKDEISGCQRRILENNIIPLIGGLNTNGCNYDLRRSVQKGLEKLK